MQLVFPSPLLMVLAKPPTPQLHVFLSKHLAALGERTLCYPEVSFGISHFNYTLPGQKYLDKYEICATSGS